MKKLLKSKSTYISIALLSLGLFLGYFGEGLLVAVTHRDQVLAITHPKVQSPLVEVK